MSSTRASLTRRVIVAAAGEVARSVIFSTWRGSPASARSDGRAGYGGPAAALAKAGTPAAGDVLLARGAPPPLASLAHPRSREPQALRIRLAALIRGDCLLGPRLALQPLLELPGETLEHTRQLRTVRATGIVRGNGDGGCPITRVGERDGPEVGVLDRPAVSLH